MYHVNGKSEDKIKFNSDKLRGKSHATVPLLRGPCKSSINSTVLNTFPLNLIKLHIKFYRPMNIDFVRNFNTVLIYIYLYLKILYLEQR